jgi:hypothetical protein
MKADDPIIKEHKHGCSINTPHCRKCGKYCDGMKSKNEPLATGGYRFYAWYFYCSRCREWIEATEHEIDILNRWSVTKNSWDSRVLKPPVGKQQHSDNPYSDVSTFYPK